MHRSSLSQPIQRATAAAKAVMLRCLALPRASLLRALLDADHFLSWSISCLRAATIISLFIVTLLQPVRGRLDQFIEINILLFAAYDVAIEVLRRQFPRWRSFTWVVVLDLPVVLIIYAFGGAPGGLLFVLVFLAVICAAVTLPLRQSLVYAVVTVVVLLIIDPTFPLWSAEAGDVRRLSGRLLILVLTALGTAILTLRLRSEQASAQANRNEAVRHAELNRLRSEFVAMISHDLRTPLAGARAGIGMLEASTHARLQPDERELLASTRRNIQRLGRLIDDLLTLNQLEVGAIQLTRAPLDLRTVVADILPTVHPLIAEKEQLLEVDLPDPLPVVGDVRRLEQVVLNLVANAHQHTPSGTRIVVSGDVEDGRVRLCICDTGLGIPPTERDRIFERFYQVGKGRGAAGLGLAIVKGLVELHAGRVWVESTPHDGTTFTVALPRSTAQEHADV